MAEETVNLDDAGEAVKKCNVEELPAIKQWCSTGCTVLDLAIANQLPGGIPVGRVIQVYGGYSTCKTVLATTILGYALRQGMLADFVDIERTFDANFAKMYGLDATNKDFRLIDTEAPETCEAFFDKYLPSLYKKKKARIIAIDSWTALPTEVERKDDLMEKTMGLTKPRIVSTAFRKCLRDIADNNISLFVIDQTRDNISGMGRAEVVSGGRALEFYSSVRIYLHSDGRIENTAKKVIGFWLKFEVTKNKVAPPMRSGRIRILFDFGLDDIASSLYFISEAQNGEKEAKTKGAEIEIWGEKKIMSNWIKKIESENLEDKLKEEVAKLWKQVYKTEVRKQRVW
jgi:recombination protein RecA